MSVTECSPPNVSELTVALDSYFPMHFVIQLPQYCANELFSYYIPCNDSSVHEIVIIILLHEAYLHIPQRAESDRSSCSMLVVITFPPASFRDVNLTPQTQVLQINLLTTCATFLDIDVMSSTLTSYSTF